MPSNNSSYRTALRTTAFIISVITVLLPLSYPSAEEAPPAEKILDRYIEVTGGSEAYARLENIKSVGKFGIPAQGIVFSITSYSARPDYMYVVLESPQLGRIERGVSRDGVAWQNNIMMGASIKEGKEKEQTLNDAIFNKMARWRKVYSKVENAGITDVNGKECYEIVLTYNSGMTERLFFDKESGLIVKSSRTNYSEMGEIESESYISDYRDVNGVLFPFKTVVDVMGQKREITIDKVEINIEMAETRFATPDAIKSLMKKKEETEAE